MKTKIVILALPALALAAPLIANHDAIADIQAHTLESYPQIKFIPARNTGEPSQNLTSTPSNETRVYDPHTTEPHRPVQGPNNQTNPPEPCSPALGGGCYKPKPVAKRNETDTQNQGQERCAELWEGERESSKRLIGTPNPGIERPVCRPYGGATWWKRDEPTDTTEQDGSRQNKNGYNGKTISFEEAMAFLENEKLVMPEPPGLWLERNEPEPAGNSEETTHSNQL